MSGLYIRQELIHAICWTLIHSLWLGILAAMLAGIVITGTRKLPVAIRYRLLVMDLLLFVLAVGITFCYEVKQGHGENGVVAVAGTGLASVARPSEDHGSSGNSANLGSPTAADQPTDNLWPRIDYQPAVNYLNQHAFIIVDIWLICLFIQLSRLISGLYGIRRLRQTGKNASDKWLDTLLLLSGQLGLKRRVSLLESASVKIPSAAGFFKPVILVPLGILSNLPADQVETILLHELAHIKRGDYLTNLLLHITEAVFFFNPGLRWLNTLIRREREACCDDMVLAVTADRTIYLDALVSFREYLAGNLHSAYTVERYTVALGKRRNSLLWRVRRILSQENKTLDIMEKTILSFGLAAVIMVGLISMKPAPPAPAPVPPAPAPTVITTPPPLPISGNRKDTLPGRNTSSKQLRRDSLQRIKAKLELQQVSSDVYDAMKLRMEEQTLRNKVIMDSLSKLQSMFLDSSMNNAEFLQMINYNLQLAIDNQQSNADIKKLTEQRVRQAYDRVRQADDGIRQADKGARVVEDENTGGSDRRIRQITKNLVEAGLIPDHNNFSFSLNGERLLVNGKPAPDLDFQKLKAQYIHSPKDHFNHMVHGGNTQTEISVDND